MIRRMHNAGRSQIAQAFFERHARAESAGSAPARELWPQVVEAMTEFGVDISDRKPRKLLLEMQLQADWAVTLGCGERLPGPSPDLAAGMPAMRLAQLGERT